MEMMRVRFKAKATTKDNPNHEFNNTWVFGDIINSGGKTYIHPVCNKVNVSNELGKIIIMHEVIPNTVFDNPELLKAGECV